MGGKQKRLSQFLSFVENVRLEHAMMGGRGDVPVNLDTEVTTNGARGGGEGVGGTDHQTRGGDDSLSFVGEADHGARGEERNQISEEGALLVLSVVLSSLLLGGVDELHSDELESALLPAREDLSSLKTPTVSFSSFFTLFSATAQRSGANASRAGTKKTNLAQTWSA